jgi:hypothetical protein
MTTQKQEEAVISAVQRALLELVKKGIDIAQGMLQVKVKHLINVNNDQSDNNTVTVVLSPLKSGGFEMDEIYFGHNLWAAGELMEDDEEEIKR